MARDGSPVRFTRRHLFAVGGISISGVILAACGGTAGAPTVAPAATAPPAPATATSAPTAAPTAAPTTAPAAQPTVAPAAQATPPPKNVTLNFATGQPPGMPLGTQLMFTEWQKATGVSIKWQGIPSPSEGEKIKLMLSSGDVSDIFIGPRSIIGQLGPQACLALDDLITKNGPNISSTLKEHAQEVPPIRSADGKMYGIYGRTEYVYKGWIYRKDLATKLGVAKLETLDQWQGFLQAAKKDDPNTHGVGIYGSILDLAASLRGAFGIHGQLSGWYTMRDNKLADGAILAEAKDVIDTVRSWYTTGLVDPDMVKTVQDQQNRDKWLAGKTIVGVNDYLGYADDSIAGYLKLHPGATFDVAASPPPTGPKGERADLQNFFGWSGFGYGLGPKCPDPDAAIKFIDYIFSDDGVRLFWLGVKGQTYEMNGDSYQFTAKVKDEITQAVKAGKNGITSPTTALWVLYGLGYPFFGVKNFPAPGKQRDAYIGPVETQQSVDNQNLEKPYLNKLIPSPVFNPTETTDLQTMSADITTYREETWTKMITGKLGMDQWDAYVSQMKKLGAEKVQDIYNTAYQRTYPS